MVKKRNLAKKYKRAIGFISIFAAALLAFNLFAEQLTIYAANRVTINDSLTGKELASVEIDGNTGNPLSSDWIFGASYAARRDETGFAPIYKLGETYSGNHVTAVNKSDYIVKLTARVIAAPEDNSETGSDDTPPPGDEIINDWSNPQDVVADWRDIADADPRDPDWSFYADGGVRTQRTVLERTETTIERLSGNGASAFVIPKTPEQPGLIHGMTLDMGELRPGEYATYAFTMTLNGRNYWNASQRARAVFYLEFTARYLPPDTDQPTETPRPTITSSPAKTDPPSETAPSSEPPVIHTPTPPSEAATQSPDAPAIDEPRSPTPTPSGNDSGRDKLNPRTGGTRTKLYLIFIILALVLAFFMLKERDKSEEREG
ncbi:MAG: hypothetical protein LBS84_07365 [Clostridiales bacterium]|jgi:hypothetical protein|nr:hypothetical protein [Clostridiales bacterium]